jgi:hypothetical protein
MSEAQSPPIFQSVLAAKAKARRLVPAGCWSFQALVHVQQPIGAAAQHDKGGNAPQQKDRHRVLLWSFTPKGNARKQLAVPLVCAAT